MIPVRPHNGWIVVEEDTPPNEIGGILLPTFLERDHYEGNVVAVGPPRWKRKKGKWIRRKPGVEVGDRVAVPSGAGTLVTIDGKYYWFVREEAILWIAEEAGDAEANV